MGGVDGRVGPRSRPRSCWGRSAPSRLLSFGAPLALLLCIRTVSYASVHPVEHLIHAYRSPRECCRLSWVGWLYRRNTGGWRAVSSYASLFQSSFHIHILLETRIPFLFPGIWFFFLSLDSAFSLFLSLPYLCFINKQHSIAMAAPFVQYGITPGQSAEAPKRPHLYVGNLSPRVTDYILTEIFAVAGPVVSAKIIQDRNFQHGGFNYGFVEYADMRSAEQALTTLNGRKIFDAEIRVNWAYQGNQNKEDTQHHYHVFVGDLSPEVNDDVLSKAFGAFGSLSEARVMWDMNSGKSRGYGFLSFRYV